MADTTVTTTIADLKENTVTEDADLMIVGNAGTSELRKINWSNILNSIKEKLTSWTFSTLNTEDKTLPGAVNEIMSLNTDLENSVDELNTKLENNAIKITELSAPQSTVAINGAVSISCDVSTSRVVNAVWYAGGGSSGMVYVSFASGYLHFRNISGASYTPTSAHKIYAFYY